MTSQQTTTSEKEPIEVQQTSAQPTEQTTSSSTAKQSVPAPTSQTKELPAARGNLTVNFLDVGQGDSILLDTMMIQC
jgi:hypothetical protein